MTNTNSEQKKLMTFKVRSLDVWGHSHEDCHNHGCECANPPLDEEGAPTEVECQCGFDVNQSFAAGTFTIEVTGTTYNVGVMYTCPECKGTGDGHPNMMRIGGTEFWPCKKCQYSGLGNRGKVSAEFTAFSPTDAQLLAALKDEGFLKAEATEDNVEFEGDLEGVIIVEEKSNGEPLYWIELDETVTKAVAS
jgi:ribosomal protein L37AE/L43A